MSFVLSAKGISGEGLWALKGSWQGRLLYIRLPRTSSFGEQVELLTRVKGIALQLRCSFWWEEITIDC